MFNFIVIFNLCNVSLLWKLCFSDCLTIEQCTELNAPRSALLVIEVQTTFVVDLKEEFCFCVCNFFLLNICGGENRVVRSNVKTWKVWCRPPTLLRRVNVICDYSKVESLARTCRCIVDIVLTTRSSMRTPANMCGRHLLHFR